MFLFESGALQDCSQRLPALQLLAGTLFYGAVVFFFFCVMRCSSSSSTVVDCPLTNVSKRKCDRAHYSLLETQFVFSAKLGKRSLLELFLFERLSLTSEMFSPQTSLRSEIQIHIHL